MMIKLIMGYLVQIAKMPGKFLKVSAKLPEVASWQSNSCHKWLVTYLVSLSLAKQH